MRNITIVLCFFLPFAVVFANDISENQIYFIDAYSNSNLEEGTYENPFKSINTIIGNLNSSINILFFLSNFSMDETLSFSFIEITLK